jgi:hypothetical protein
VDPDNRLGHGNNAWGGIIRQATCCLVLKFTLAVLPDCGVDGWSGPTVHRESSAEH